MVVNDERKIEVFNRVDRAITLLRLIRGKVQKGRHVDPSEFSDLAKLVSSLRHNCEMHNQERLSN